RFALIITCVVGAGLWAGCGGGSSGGSAVTSTKPTSATNSSIIAVDCIRQRAYVPLGLLNADLHRVVAVLDLTVTPNQNNPVVAIVDTGLIALPRAAAANIQTGQVVVLADPVLDTGSVVVINESNLAVQSFPFPTGSRPDETSGVVIDD